MGTSDSYGGPPAEQSLLPSWALPSPPEAEPEPDGHEGDGSFGDDSSVDSGEDSKPDGVQPAPDPNSPRLQPSTQWRTAKSNLTKAASGGGGGRAIRTAGRSYVRGRGGSRTATRTSVSGRSAAAGIGSFLSNVSRQGVGAALNSLGLGKFVGRTVQEVFAAIANALAPDGAKREETAARKAVNEALYRVFQRCDFETSDLSPLESMTRDEIAQAIKDSVSGYIYSRWLEELGQCIERGSVSPNSAVQMERVVKNYVRESVKLETREIDVVAVNWSSPEGGGIIESIFQDAYSFLEVAE